LIAERDKQAFAISVKARNKFENSIAGKKLNSRYKLTDDPQRFELEAKQKYRCLASWIAISLDFDAGFFDAYFGVINDLEGNRKGIVMSPEATEKYKALARFRSLAQMGISVDQMQSLKNVYKRK